MTKIAISIAIVLSGVAFAILTARREMDAVVRKIMAGISAQREEIARAFLAKYGCEPDEICQMVQDLPGGGTKWWLEWHGKHPAALAEHGLMTSADGKIKPPFIKRRRTP
jgi:hypothetical protein